MFQLIRCEGRRSLLGLILAQGASEELGAARDTGVLLPSARRMQLERLMLKGMPQMLAALNGRLLTNLVKTGTVSNGRRSNFNLHLLHNLNTFLGIC